MQDCVDALAARNTARGGTPAVGTVRLALGALRQALKYALVRGLVARNVATDVRAHGGRARRPRFLTAAEAARLLSAAGGHRHEVLYRVALILGMRQGELLGLRWPSIDLDGGRLDVCEQPQRRMPSEGAGARLLLRGLKSDAAHRTLLLPPALVALRLYPAKRLYLNPDCGFGTFSNRPMNSAEIASSKLRSMVEVAQRFRV